MRTRRPGGRRPGTTQTRDAILEAAQESFTRNGYPGTTVRGVARAADVDPALVMHFFGNKDGLFCAALEHDYMPVDQLVDVGAGECGEMGKRLLEHYLTFWEDPETAGRMYCVLNAAATSSAAAGLLRDFVSHKVHHAFVERMNLDHPRARAAFVGTQLVGIAMLRYILRLEPLASMPKEQVVAVCAPTIQRYLTGDLPLTEPSAESPIEPPIDTPLAPTSKMRTGR